MHHLVEKVVIGSAITAGALSGCSSPEQAPHPTPTEKTGLEAPIVAPSSECPPAEIAQFGQKFTKQQIKECLEVREKGTVALVGFGLSQETLAATALDSQQLIHKATKGLINLTITPHVASEAAIKTLNEKSPTCVDADDDTTWASAAAHHAMPEIAAYDHIIGASSKSECAESAGGFASVGTKLIDMFEVTDNLPIPFKAEGETLVYPSVHLSVQIVHELLHGVGGLGHANQLAYDGTTPNAISEANETGPTEKIDLQKHLTRGQVEEYADQHSIQGEWATDTIQRRAG